jgi:hypothetical protein
MRKIVFYLTLICGLCLYFAGCAERFPSQYALEMPEIPEMWASLLGQPHWRIEWLDSGGQKQKTDILPGESAVIEPPTTWTNPVLAWPYWPEHNLIPGAFRPAGALFPFDADEQTLSLNWKAGPDAVFYWELALANKEGSSKLPGNFNWPRFRELFETDKLKEEVRNDPWLIDWRSVAEKTISSSFDQRRLVAKSCASITIPVSSGPWYGTSPFFRSLYFIKGETPAFPVYSDVTVWISREGILRCNEKAWIFTAWEAPR